ncbi:60S ribosomal protein L32 [Tanacetum coccineum]
MIIYLLCVVLTIIPINGFDAGAPLEELCESLDEDLKSQVYDLSPQSCSLDACLNVTIDQWPKNGYPVYTTCLGPACISCIRFEPSEMSSDDEALFGAVPVEAFKTDLEESSPEATDERSKPQYVDLAKYLPSPLPPAAIIEPTNDDNTEMEQCAIMTDCAEIAHNVSIHKRKEIVKCVAQLDIVVTNEL